jgi:hypothetical protein
MQSFGTTEQLYIDSTLRDRNTYPNPNSFVISPGDESRSNRNIAIDPVVDGIPYAKGTTQAGSTTTTVVLDAISSTIVNYYSNSYIRIEGFPSRKITSYSPVTATVNLAYSTVPPGGINYWISHGIPSESGTFQAGSTTSSYVLDLNASTIDEHYNNNYIYILTGVCAGNIVKIKDYIGATKKASTISTCAPGVGDKYEISIVTSDNNRTLHLGRSKSHYIGKGSVYQARLVSLSIPNMELLNSGGGSIINQPHVFVEISSGHSASTIGTISSNNITAYYHGTFIVPIDDDNITSSFINLKSSMLPHITFNRGQNITFNIYHKNGELLQWITSETLSPQRPNNDIQVHALMELTHIVKYV